MLTPSADAGPEMAPDESLTRSLVELLHPDGQAAGVVVLGGACPSYLEAPGRTRMDLGDSCEALILAPTAEECRTAAWLENAVSGAARHLTPDGVIYGVVPPRWRRSLLRLSRTAGLMLDTTFVHKSVSASTDYLIPCERRVMWYVLDVLPLRRARQTSARLVWSAPGAAAAVRLAWPGVGLVLRRPGARPIAEWASEGGAAGTRPSVLLRRRLSDKGRVVVAVFGASGRWPSTIVKVPLTKAAELERQQEYLALNEVLGQAARAGARLPAPRLMTLRDGLTALRLDVVSGVAGARVLSLRPGRLTGVLEQLADWLERWSLESQSPAVAEAHRLDREILAPAADLAPLLEGGEQYLAWLHARCDAVLGQPLPAVATHNDLSMVNVLFDGKQPPGVIDWEFARPNGLPLTDFFYAAADALSATGAYRHRVRSLQTSFDPVTDYGQLVDRLGQRLATSLGLSADVVELLKHATLVHHAANEHARNRISTRSFVEALQWMVNRTLGARTWTATANLAAPASPSSPLSPVTGRQELPVRARRLDWRFLLPEPHGGDVSGRVVVLGGAPGTLEALHRLGLTDDVSEALSSRPADTVVVLRGATAHQRDSAPGAVAPGGVFYCEVDRLTPEGRWMSPRRLAKRLRAAGLTPVAVYWLVPHCEATTRFIPLDSTLAIHWYLGTLYRRHTRLRSYVGRAASLLARWRLLSSCVRAFGMVAVREGHARTPHPLTDPRLSVEADVPGFCTALLTSGQDDASRIVFVPFSERGVSSRVVKLARLPEFNDLNDREFDTLATLRTRLDPELCDTIPAPLWRGRTNGLSIITETYGPGPTLLASTSAVGASIDTRIDDLQQAASWLTAFHSQWVIERRPWTDAHVRRWVRAPLEGFAQVFDLAREDRALVERVIGRAEELAGEEIPIVLQHNDFGPWNVHRDRDRVTVVDWEFSGGGPDGRAGLPMEDLVYFATYWLFAARRLVTDSAQQQGFAEFVTAPATSNDAIVKAVRVALSSYLRALRIDPRFRGLAVPMTWIRRATAHAARSGPHSAACRRQLGFLRTLARSPERLFDEHG